MSEYFIRRGAKVVGPVSAEQIQRNLGNGKVRPTDEIGGSPDGPWQIVSDVMGMSTDAVEEAAETAVSDIPQAPDPQPIVPVEQELAVAPLAEAPVPVSAPAGVAPAAASPEDSPVSTIGGSKISIDGRPSFAHIRIELGPGETIIGEADAMASMAGDMDLKARFNGGFFSGLKKKFLGGESLFINEYSNNADQPKHLVLAPSTPGDIRQLTLDGNTSFCLQPGAFIACTPGVKLGTKWAGLASLIGREGLFKLQVSGTGTVWYGAFGALLEREIDGQYIVDTGHLVGYDPHIKLKVQLAGGIFSSFFGGEGLVTRVEGKGKIILQTRSLGGLAGWLNPILPS